MAKKIVLKNGELAKLQKQLGMDSAEEVKKVILAVHGSSYALDEDDKKSDAKDEDDKKAEDEDDEVIVEDSDDDEKKAKDEEKQTQAERDNESEAMRLKDREKREEKDRDRDREEAKDSKGAMDAAEVRNSIMGIFAAGREVEPLVGQIALDGFSSDHAVYEYALKQKGIDTRGINTAGLAALVKAQKSSGMAQDSAPAHAGNVNPSVKSALARFK